MSLSVSRAPHSRPPLLHRLSHFLLASGLLITCGCDNSLQRTLTEAQSLLQQNNADAAIRLCDTALQSQPNSIELMLLRAQARLQRDDRGDSQQAIDDLSLILKLDEKNQQARYYRGMAHMRRQAYSAAVSDLDVVLEHSPQHLEALLLRAEANFNISRHQLVIADCDSAIEIADDSAASYLLRGRARLSSNDAAGAETDFTKALELDSGNAAAHWYRAIAFVALGRSDEAKRDRNRAADLDRRFSILNSEFRENLVEGLGGDQGKNQTFSPLKIEIDR